MIVLYESPEYKIAYDPDSKQESGSESTETETETETTVSADSDILQSINRTNDLLTGIIFFMGLMFGLIGMTIFWNRFRGD